MLQHEIAQVTLNGPRGGLPFLLFRNASCFQVARSILEGTSYPLVPCSLDVHTIVDIGANIGAATLFFAICYPAATLYALEPASQPFALLEKNTKSLPNVRRFPFGLHFESKTAMLYSGCGDSVESSIYPSARTSADCGESILLRSARQFLCDENIANIDILKIDTEGCEIPILQSLADYLPRVQVLYVEYHSERDRLLIDNMMTPTHLLWSAQAALVHRGEFCYLKKGLSQVVETATHACEILTPLV